MGASGAREIPGGGDWEPKKLVWTNFEALPRTKISFNFQDALCRTVHIRHGMQGGFSGCYPAFAMSPGGGGGGTVTFGIFQNCTMARLVTEFVPAPVGV